MQRYNIKKMEAGVKHLHKGSTVLFGKQGNTCFSFILFNYYYPIMILVGLGDFGKN